MTGWDRCFRWFGELSLYAEGTLHQRLDENTSVTYRKAPAFNANSPANIAIEFDTCWLVGWLAGWLVGWRIILTIHFFHLKDP